MVFGTKSRSEPDRPGEWIAGAPFGSSLTLMHANAELAITPTNTQGG